MIELTTQCPQCHHLFDVSLEQLQQRKGLLRCAQCAHIFDAYACIVAETDLDSTTTRQPTFSISPPKESDSKEPILSNPVPTTPISTPLTDALIPEPLVISTRASGRTKSPISSSQPIQSSVEIESEPYSDIRVYLHTEDAPKSKRPLEPIIPPLQSHVISQDEEDFTFVPDPDRFAPKPSEFDSKDADELEPSFLQKLFWQTLFWLLLILLAVQLLYVYRAHIANSVAFTRPVLQWMCDEIGCDIPYMREINAIEVQQSTLQQQPNFGAEQRYAYQLQLQLKNNLAWAQEWPTLVVSFSDASAAVMATMAISPEQYLSSKQIDHPFEAGAQQSIRVPVTVENKKINGFTVDKYYP